MLGYAMSSRRLALRVPVAIALLVLGAAAIPGGRAFATPPPPVAAIDVPRIARMVRLSGTVVVEALVDEEGRVRATSISRSQPALDDEAAARVAAMRFDPLIQDGKPVASSHVVPVVFEAPPPSAPADDYAGGRCAETTFALDMDARPDSSGAITARWTAKGQKGQELFVVVLFPDGAEVDTTHSWYPQRFRDDPESSGWPSWHRDGKELKAGTSGAFTFRLPAAPWWRDGRVAVVALFRDMFDGRAVVRQRVFQVERDDMGALLVSDPRATACAAGPWFDGR